MKWLIGIACFLFVVLAGCGIETVVSDTIQTNAYTVSKDAHLSDLFPDTNTGSEARDKDTDKYYWSLDEATVEDYVTTRDKLIEIGFINDVERDEYFDELKSYVAEKDGYVCYLLYSYSSLQCVVGTVEAYEGVFIGEEVEE